jgi:LAO/AO transport system kinase
VRAKAPWLMPLLTQLATANKRVAIVAVDPTSPFNYGALLGDRIRWNEHYNNPNIYIRSLATRGSLGGLSDKIIEVVDVLKAAKFDYILVETVGVGQSEVEIAGLADTTLVVLVPEAGDEIQTMKAGLMEIADIFVVNKADRPDADRFSQNLRLMLHERAATDWEVPVLKTVASRREGIDDVTQAINKHTQTHQNTHKRAYLLAQKAIQLIQKQRLKDIDRQQLKTLIEQQLTQNSSFNLYNFLQKRYF